MQSAALRWILASCGFLFGMLAANLAAAEPMDPALERRFAEKVQPFVKAFCVRCHGAEKPKGALDLTAHSTTAAVLAGHRTWDRVVERLKAEEMPPADSPKQPSADERREIIEWVTALRADFSRRNAGDPGVVLARRLSNAEFDYTIRDLTRVDIRPTREFPVDPANEAGFDNSGESLTMSPALMKKYLAAARLVADHIVLKPQGFVFAPHPAVTETDRDKYCVQRVVDFYRRHAVDYADYFQAAWRYRHRAALGMPGASLEETALAAQLSPRYLASVWSALTEPVAEEQPLAQVQAAWNNLPAPADRQLNVRRECAELRDLVVKLRREFEPKVDKLHVRGMSDGTQPFVLWKNRELGAYHMRPFRGTKPAADTPVQPADPALERFCRVFPNAFVVVDRGPYFDPKMAGQGRPLTAGFHLMQGYFRDDAPLCELVLDEAARAEIDTLWDELNFITLAPMRQYKDFIFFERAEPPRFMFEDTFDFARSEDKDATAQEKIDRLRGLHLEKVRRIGGSEVVLGAIDTFYAEISAAIRRVEALRAAAEPTHLDTLLQFTERAWRRPLSSSERDGLLGTYRSLREKDGLAHEDALRDTLAGVLLAPEFCYRFNPTAAGTGVTPLSDYALASRLSYFLWSTLPDDELLAHAAAGDLHKPEVLRAQTRRMLQDERIRGLATEFGGHWLEFRRFEEHNSVDRERFATFTNELRQAMFEEPLRFFSDLAVRDGSVLDFLNADHTFVNPLLAKHYGIAIPETAPDQWVRVERASQFGRGGLLPMAVFLTQNSPGLRTSPVKRGYWVVRRLLGEFIPPPPPEVPELPKDEAALGELTLPQLLARHREHKNCAACHDHFDSVGLVFEGYGPIGERREKDLGGKPVQTTATFPDGSAGDGIDGLRRYLREKRQDDFLDNLCRKLFAYGLGRSLILSDEETIADFRRRLAENNYRFGSLVEAVVVSPQFLNQRGREAGD